MLLNCHQPFFRSRAPPMMTVFPMQCRMRYVFCFEFTLHSLEDCLTFLAMIPRKILRI
jgi:hypothetical protein